MTAPGPGLVPGGAPGAQRRDNSVYLSAPVGALVMLDGAVYQTKADGLAYPVEDTVKSPFACVTFFRAVTYDDVLDPLDSADFDALLQRLLPSPNML